MITIRSFTPADLALGMELKGQAGWNQTEADWRRAWNLEPDGCFVGLYDGMPAATLTTCTFGSVAWIAMVLTRTEFRGRGLATALLRQSLDYAAKRGATSVRLDATALGRPVYEKLGFTVDGEVTRFFGRPRPSAPSAVPTGVCLAAWEPNDTESAARLDALMTGNNRRRLLELVRHDWPDAAWVARSGTDVVGFFLARRGSRAPQWGPCVATNDAVGQFLLNAAFERFADQNIYLDVPHANHSSLHAVQRAGLTAERNFFRMTRGQPVVEQNEQVWANFGPEKG